MVDKNDLWIGESLRVIKSGKKGTFEGLNKYGKIRLKVEDRIFLYTPDKLEIAPEEIFVPQLKFENKLTKPIQVIASPFIDLHIEKLNPHLVNTLPERIIDFQIKAFENYIEDCINSRRYDALIIHGKGTGVLRNSIHALLKAHQQVRYFHLINNDGATEVFFKY